jgi:hypothetical protein
MNRRTFLVVPLAAAVAGPSWNPGSPWRHSVSEIRFGGSGAATAARARVLQARLGVPVRAVRLPAAALAAALNAGHVEFAELEPGVGTHVAALMGDRIRIAPGNAGRAAVRTALPGAMRADLVAALS